MPSGVAGPIAGVIAAPVSGTLAVAEPPESRAPEIPSLATDQDDGGRPLWDEDDGPATWSASPPGRSFAVPTRPLDGPSGSPQSDGVSASGTAANGTAQPVVPLIPVEAARGAVGAPKDAALGGESAAPAPLSGAAPATNGTPAQAEEPAGPALDFAELRRQWPELRDMLVGGRIERMVILGTAELVDTIGSTLVVKVGSGHLKLLDDDQKRRELRGDLVRVLGRPADLRFVDEYVRQERAAIPTAGRPDETTVPETIDVTALAASDPVIQCGLRLFGGPLVRVDADADAPSVAEPPVPPSSRDEGASDGEEDGAIIGRGGMPVRDWYNY